MNNCSKIKCPLNSATFKDCNLTEKKCEYYVKNVQMTRKANLLIEMWCTLLAEGHKVITEENYDAIQTAIYLLNQKGGNNK